MAPEIRCCPCAMARAEREQRRDEARRRYHEGQRERRIVRALCHRRDWNARASECRRDIADAIATERASR